MTEKTEKPVDLALLTARTLRDHMGSVGRGKHAEELHQAIEKAEGKKAPEPEVPHGRGSK